MCDRYLESDSQRKESQTIRVRSINLICILLCELSAAHFGWSLGPQKVDTRPSLTTPRSSVACGPPNYCTRTDLASQPILEPPVSLGPTGNVGEPFVEPDFGERIVRVTDAKTEVPMVGCCAAASSAESTQWGPYDSTLFQGHGGYRFYVVDSGGGYLFFEIDAVTMALKQILHTTNPYGLGTTNKSYNWSASNWSTVSPTVIYGRANSNPAYLVRYDFATDRFSSTTGTSTTATPYIDFSTCPNLPAPILGGYGTSYSARASDTYFGAAAGGTEQGNGIYEFMAHKPSLTEAYQTCFWFDTERGTTGGTSMPAETVAEGVGQLPAPAAPAISITNGHSAQPAEVCAVVTANVIAYDQNGHPTGESLPSPEVCAEGPSDGTVSISFAEPISNPSQLPLIGPGWTCWESDAAPCTPYHVYLATAPSIAAAEGKETLQGGFVSGRTCTIPIASIKTGTATPPTVSTAGFNLHAGWTGRNGKWAHLGNQEGNTMFFWQPGSTTVYECLTFSSDYCGGHSVQGNEAWLNAAGILEVRGRQNTTMGTFGVLDNPIPTGIGSDSHLSWNNDDSTDRQPVEQVYYNSGQVGGDGSLDPNSNPCTSAPNAWLGEVLMVATDGSGKVWRFAHHRGGQCANPKANVENFGQIPIGNVSQDGKFALFHSNWGWRLGTAYYPAWQASRKYSPGSIIFDGVNYEFTVKGGTSGSVAPSWPSHAGETTADGSVTWTMNTGCTDPENPSNGESCRTDVFVVELK
jgi:hypothetical protein